MRRTEAGSSLVIVLLLLALAVATVGGLLTTVMTDTRLRASDETGTQAFYAAHGALEKLTADLGNLFLADFSPSGADIRALAANPPAISDVTFADPAGGAGYDIRFTADAQGNPATGLPRDIKTGPFQGFKALVTEYSLKAVARVERGPDSGAEVHLERQMNTIAIPVFQFGIFSDLDLSFFAGPEFDFGGRVHTNGNLFLASGTGPLTMSDKVTAVGDVIRTHLSNNWDTNTNYNGVVNIARGAGVYRALAKNEGSLLTTLGSAQNEPVWTNVSISSYNGYLRNGRTGVRRLELPFVTLGATPLDLIRRGVTGEDPRVSAQRYYTLASLRVLLSDTAADLTGLPGVTAVAPVALANAVFAGTPTGASVGNQAQQTTAATAINGNTITVASTVGFADQGQLVVSLDAAETQHLTVNYTGRTPTTFTGVTGVTAVVEAARWIRTSYHTPSGTALIPGFAKIEMQRQDGVWQDVTAEILGLGIAGRSLGGACGEPAPDAVLRLERVRINPAGGIAPCGTNSVLPTDYVPNVLYDAREGNLRDTVPVGTTTVNLGGLMHYVELDMRNLGRWLQGQIGVTGLQAMNANGFTVYFSDRRGNREPATNLETGEFGFEDFVNPLQADGLPNGIRDAGEDINNNGAVDTYGATPRVVAGSTGSFTLAARPWSAVSAAEARVNRAVFFRRALKLTHGSLGNLPLPGVTVASENPVYVEGDFNATGAGFVNGNAAAAVIADAVTLLSNNWNDETSLTLPHNAGARAATPTSYRLAVLSGKGMSFPQPAGTAQDFGTDGGVHNFLRYLEDWGGVDLRFRGSIASFFYNRQAVGTYKCCTNVYNAPNRLYEFDVNFLDPALLPPHTPMFRDVNTTAFHRITRR